MRVGRWPAVLVLLLVFFGWCMPGAVLAEADDVSLPPANIMINGDRWMPVFKAGEKVSLSIPLENTGGPAKDLTVSLAVADVDKFPFKSDRMTFTKYIPSMSDSNCLADFKLTVPSTIKPGTYPITVNISYSSVSGGGGTASGIIYVKVVNDYRQPTLTIINVKPPQDRLPAGKSSLVKLAVRNDGDLAVKDVEISLSGFANGIGLDNWSDTQDLGNMAAGELRAVSYQLNVDPETKTGTYTLDVNFTYKDDSGQEYKKASKIFLPVSGKDTLDEMTPRIIIDNYSYDGYDHVIAGQTFTLSLSLINTSETISVKNIKLSLTSDGGIFTPVGSGNTLFIREIKPGEKIEKSIDLKAKESAEAQTFSISADMDYQDVKGNKYTDKEIISIPVAQTIQLLIPQVKTPADASVGAQLSISTDFYNTGRAALRNLRIHTEGDFEARDSELFLGTFEPGKSEYYDTTIIPSKPGDLNGRIVFDYDDNNGQHYQTIKDFKLTVHKAVPMAPPEGIKPPAEETNKFSFKWWMVPAALAVLGIPAFIIYRRRKKAKEEQFLDE